jgi:hypothetical protein
VPIRVQFANHVTPNPRTGTRTYRGSFQVAFDRLIRFQRMMITTHNTQGARLRRDPGLCCKTALRFLRPSNRMRTTQGRLPKCTHRTRRTTLQNAKGVPQHSPGSASGEDTKNLSISTSTQGRGFCGVEIVQAPENVWTSTGEHLDEHRRASGQAPESVWTSTRSRLAQQKKTTLVGWSSVLIR